MNTSVMILAYYYIIILLQDTSYIPSLVVDCGQLPNPANGLKFGSEFTYNKVLTFDCNPGYKLVGNRKRRCQESGSWSGTAPICVGK